MSGRGSIFEPTRQTQLAIGHELREGGFLGVLSVWRQDIHRRRLSHCVGRQHAGREMERGYKLVGQRHVIEHDQKVVIGVPTGLRIPAQDAITSLEQGLLPIQEFAGYNGARRHAPTENGLPIAFLTADLGRSDAAASPMLSMPLQPVKFLEVLLENTARAVVFGRSGACVVNLPDPAHLALYTLMASTPRPPSECSKSYGELEQAATLIEWHIDNQREDRIQQAWQHLRGRDPSWGGCVDEGLASLARRYPPLASAFGKQSEEWLPNGLPRA